MPSDRYFEIWTSGTTVAVADDDSGADSGATGAEIFTNVHTSEVVKLTLNPVWKNITIDLDATKRLFFKVYDWDRIGNNDFIGKTAETTVGDLLALPALPLINPKKMPGGKKHKAGYTDSGVLHVQVATVDAPPPRRSPPPPSLPPPTVEESAKDSSPVEESPKEGSAGESAASDSTPASYAKVPPPSREALLDACTALCKLFAAKHKFVSDKVATGHVPSPGDLGAFLRQCVKDVQPHAQLLVR